MAAAARTRRSPTPVRELVPDASIYPSSRPYQGLLWPTRRTRRTGRHGGLGGATDAATVCRPPPRRHFPEADLTAYTQPPQVPMVAGPASAAAAAAPTPTTACATNTREPPHERHDAQLPGRLALRNRRWRTSPSSHCRAAVGRDATPATPAPATAKPPDRTTSPSRCSAGRDKAPATPVPATAKPSDDRRRRRRTGRCRTRRGVCDPCAREREAVRRPRQAADTVPATSPHLRSSASTSGDQRTSSSGAAPAPCFDGDPPGCRR